MQTDLDPNNAFTEALLKLGSGQQIVDGRGLLQNSARILSLPALLQETRADFAWQAMFVYDLEDIVIDFLKSIN